MTPAVSPKATVSLLNYNGAAHLDRCVSALLALRGLPFEVVIVDNASTDGSGEAIRARFAAQTAVPFRYLPRRTNGGYGAAHNDGAAAARGEYVAFVNVTVELEPEWLSIVAWMDRHPDVAFAFGPILHADDRDRIESLGGLFDPAGRLTVIGHNRRAGHRLDGPAPLEWEVTSVLGAAFVGRRSAFRELGGFDPSLFMYFDESELCWRAWRSGWRCAFVHDPARAMRAYHARHGTVPGGLDRLRLANVHRTDVWMRYADRLTARRIAAHFHMAVDDLYRAPRSLAGYAGDILRKVPNWPARRRAVPPPKVPEERYLRLPEPPGFESLPTLEPAGPPAPGGT